MTETAAPEPRDADNWAANVDRLRVSDRSSKHGYSVDGRRVAGPMNGFGRLWQRTYSAFVGPAVSPEQLVADWRLHFGEYWPPMGRFHGSVSSIQPGDVTTLTAGGVTTGILVLYADATSFTFLTPEGHMFAAMITFSAERDDHGATVAQIRMLLRCSDPVFEAMWPLARRGEDIFWPGVLRNLAAAHGTDHVEVLATTECLDRRRLWRNWTNVRYNAALRSIAHAVGMPFRRDRASMRSEST
jgi:hypothetical protein